MKTDVAATVLVKLDDGTTTHAPADALDRVADFRIGALEAARSALDDWRWRFGALPEVARAAQEVDLALVEAIGATCESAARELRAESKRRKREVFRVVSPEPSS